MRILHTSDWHLGRSFGPTSLLDHQQQFLDWLVATVVAERIDLVVVAGDVFDRAIAPTEAVVMFRDVLRRLAERTRVAVITGNHDGADRVNTYGQLLDLSGVVLRGGYEAVGEVFTLQASDGPLDLVLLPFLDPQAAPDGFGRDERESSEPAGGATDDGALARRIARTHQSVLVAATSTAMKALSSPRSLAVAHAFVDGGSVSDSERQLVVGGTGTVDAQLFAPFSYTALGHLHRPQDVSVAAGRVRYSGTPLAYSFSEQHAKSVTLIDMAATGGCSVTEVSVPVGRSVLTVTGAIDDLLRQQPSTEATSPFVRAILTDSTVVLDAKSRLAEVYPHIVEIVLQPERTDPSTGHVDLALDRRALSAGEVADEFWMVAVGVPPTENERAVLHAALSRAEAQLDGRGL